MHTSAGIGAHFGKGLEKKLAHTFALEGALRAFCSCVLALVVAGVCAFVSMAKTVEDQARCDVERERAGFGRAAALRALDRPDAQSAFAYRVSTDPQGYRVHVFALDGDYAGEGWERDALGRVTHVGDICAPD